MPTFYNIRDNGVDYDFEDMFVPSELFREGNLWIWGGESYGALGNGQLLSNTSTPVTTFAGKNNWKQVSVGNYRAAAIKSDGTLWTWGQGANGALGNNTTANRSTPVTTFVGGTNWIQVNCNLLGSHVAAIKTDGTLWTWGAGANGRLGNNATLDRITPITTFAGRNNWKQVSCGQEHTAAIKTDGTLWTWGAGANGRLGNNETLDKSTPITTFAGGNNWKQVSCGQAQITAIKTDGTLWTWGVGTNGRLGNNTATDRSTPVTTFAGGNNWKQVSCGQEHIAAIKTDGTLWAWGSGQYGALGNNAATDRSTPVTTFAGGNNWKQVSCGYRYTSAIKSDGTLWAWGRNFFGVLGNSSESNKFTPVTTFAGGNNWKQVSSGVYNTAAVLQQE